MKKRWILPAALLLAMTLSVSGLAAKPATADEGSVYVASETVLTNEGKSTYWSLTDSGYVIEDISSAGASDEYYLRDASGVRVNKEPYEGIQSLAYVNYETDLFAVTKEYSKLNSWALMTEQGEIVSDFAYSYVKLLDEKWLIAAVGVKATSDDYSFNSFNWTNCKTERLDLFYKGKKIGEVPGSEVGEFTAYTNAYGDFLALPSNKAGYFNVYGTDMSKNELYDYTVSDEGYWNPYYGEYYTAADGKTRHISGVEVYTADCPLTASQVQDPYHVRDDLHAVLDLQNKVVAEIKDYEITSLYPFVNGYAAFYGYENETWNGGYGVLNDKWEIVLPPVYANAGNWGAATFTYGFCQLTKDNRFGYVNEAGEEVVPISYSTNNSVMQKALYTFLYDLDGSYRLVSAARGLTERKYGNVYSWNNYDCPVIIASDAESGLYGAIDYNGDVIVPFEYEYGYNFTLTTDGEVLMVSKDNETRLYDLTWDFGKEEKQEPVVDPIVDPVVDPVVDPIVDPQTDPKPAESDGLTMKIVDLFTSMIVGQGDWSILAGDQAVAAIHFRYDPDQDTFRFTMTRGNGTEESGTMEIAETEEDFLLILHVDGSKEDQVFGMGLRSITLYDPANVDDQVVLEPAEE